jgi:hypothetical protein
VHGSINIKNTAELTRSALGITRFVLFLCMPFHRQPLYSLPDLDNSLCIQWEAGCRIQERSDVANVIVSALIERILLSNKGHEALNVYCVYIIQLFCYFIDHNLLKLLITTRVVSTLPPYFKVPMVYHRPHHILQLAHTVI